MNRPINDNNDDIIFGDETSIDDVASWADDISLDIDEITEEKPEEVKAEVNEPTEEVKSEEQEVTDEATTDAGEEEVDFDKLFAEIDDANEAIEKIESNDTTDNSSEVSVLKQALNNMEQMIKKLTNEKSDLVYKNAELEAFWWENMDPKILILSRNLSKAKDWDEKSKTKIISTLKDMLYDMTGEDFDTAKINKDIDILTAAESYNSSSDPQLKAKKQEDDWFAL